MKYKFYIKKTYTVEIQQIASFLANLDFLNFILKYLPDKGNNFTELFSHLLSIQEHLYDI